MASYSGQALRSNWNKNAIVIGFSRMTKGRNGTRVFLSYAEKDKAYASSLAESLSRRGFNVWFAAWELLPGDNAALKTGEALERSDAMVVLLSPEAGENTSVQQHIEYALMNRRFKDRLFAILVRPTRQYPWILNQLKLIQQKKSPERTSKEIAVALKKSA